MCAKQIKENGEVPTTGHEWDGIREYDNPMPRWWLWTFYITIIWSIAYCIVYPAWPLLNAATQGMWGEDPKGDPRLAVAAEIKRVADGNEGMNKKLVNTDLAAIGQDQALADYARASGAAIFKTWCAQCHGAGAAGLKAGGYPNLLDDDWLWGGDIENIHTTISHGIRNTTDADARYSEMPKFGTDGLLDKTQIANVVEYVLQISQQDHDKDMAGAGAQVFAENCVSCHMENGKGDQTQGAPNLTDAIWLYGGDRDTITKTVTNARFGVMPGWQNRLSEDDIRAVAFYVHSLGGGK